MTIEEIRKFILEFSNLTEEEKKEVMERAKKRAEDVFDIYVEAFIHGKK